MRQVVMSLEKVRSGNMSMCDGREDGGNHGQLLIRQEVDAWKQ